MSTRIRIILILLVVATNLFSFRQIRKGRMSLNHSLLWIFTSLVLLVIAVFPDIAYWLSARLGIGLPVNLVYLSASFFSFILFIYLTNVVSREDRNTRRLTQHISLLEKRIRELEAKLGETGGNPEPPDGEK